MKLTAALAFAAGLAGMTYPPPCPPAPTNSRRRRSRKWAPSSSDYLVNNPHVLREAIEALDKQDKAKAADGERQQTVTDQAGALFSSKFQATVGNPKGSATLVEFFDYNCHYCKGALPDIAQLMKDDPNLRLVLKDFPVLGPGSVEAASGRQRGAQPIAGRQVLGVPHQAIGHARTDRQG